MRFPPWFDKLTTSGNRREKTLNQFSLPWREGVRGRGKQIKSQKLKTKKAGTYSVYAMV